MSLNKSKLHINLDLKNRFKFVKTIRFKLTLLYSVILFALSVILVFSLNLYLNAYLTSNPSLSPPPPMMIHYNDDSNTVIVFNDLKAEEQLRIKTIRLNDLQRIQTLSIIALFPVAVISFILGYIVSGGFLSPLTHLKNEFDNLQTKDLGKTIPVKIDDEVGRLVTSFNVLSLRLKNAFDTQERFVQDASHELKTPLTVIQTNLDTVADDPNASRAEMQEAMANALLGMKNLRKLTESLLQLSETEQMTDTPFDLGQLIKNQTDSLSELAKQMHVKLETFLPKIKVTVSGDDLALGRSLYNLIENAIKYSDSTKAPVVKVSMQQPSADKKVQVVIQDNGPGIPEEFQKKIFARFYRIDKSRSRQSGGFGLGLAIAKKIIKAHHGSIELTSKPGNTEFRVTLPLK